jgi:hypothetical protein
MVVFTGIMPPLDDAQTKRRQQSRFHTEIKSLLSDDRLYGTIQLHSIRADGETLFIVISPNNKTGGRKTLA